MRETLLSLGMQADLSLLFLQAPQKINIWHISSTEPLFCILMSSKFFSPVVQSTNSSTVISQWFSKSSSMHKIRRDHLFCQNKSEELLHCKSSSHFWQKMVVWTGIVCCYVIQTIHPRALSRNMHGLPLECLMLVMHAHAELAYMRLPT